MKERIITVLVTIEECINRKFTDCWGCPLFYGLQQQYPELGVQTVGGASVIFKDWVIGVIQNNWDENIVTEILDGQHPKGYKVQIKLSKSNQRE